MNKSSKNRKQDHIDMALQTQIRNEEIDLRFNYEPLADQKPPYAGAEVFSSMKFPLWISSMTGGVDKGKMINLNLAKAAKKYGLAMGLGSCRVLLDSNSRFEDFNVRPVLGDQPLFANLGIAQVRELLEFHKLHLVDELINKLEADGLVIHINPLQEIFQPEGDDINFDLYHTIVRALESFSFPVIVKEVGQGLGPQSLLRLMKLPIYAIETASFGGTNFTVLEQLRRDNNDENTFKCFAKVGHSADEMVNQINFYLDNENDVLCKNIIVSGGVKNFLDGYFYINKLNTNALYGQASTLMRYAQSSFDELDAYIENQIKGYRIAEKFLRIKK